MFRTVVGKRFCVLLGLVVLSSVPSLVSAQVVINNAPHAGVSPGPITSDPATGTIFVADVFSGNAFTYNLSLVNTGMIPSPGGPLSTCTGIAFNPADGLLYWSIFTGISNDLWSTTTTGASPSFIGSLNNPGGGVVVGMDFDNLNLLWVNDANAAQYTAHDPLTALWLGTPPCPNPGGPGALGFGITFRGASLPGLVFEVTSGTAAQGQVAQIVPVTLPLSASSGGGINIFVPGLAVLGIESVASGSTGVRSIYVVENAGGTITELAANNHMNRGDCDANGVLNVLLDAIFLLNFLFQAGSPVPPCQNACDADDASGLSISDAAYLFNYGFAGGPPPPPPFGVCGADPTPAGSPTCVTYAPCP